MPGRRAPPRPPYPRDLPDPASNPSFNLPNCESGGREFVQFASHLIFAAVPRADGATAEMRALRSELDERLDDFEEAVGQTVGQRIDLLEEETRRLREELRSEIGGVQRRLQ